MTEAHEYTYYPTPDTEDLFFHVAECWDCGAEYSLSHNWKSALGEYICTDCGLDSTVIPEIMSLSDGELEIYLSSLSDEELATVIASLPEDIVARVTALLPSKDDSLTE